MEDRLVQEVMTRGVITVPLGSRLIDVLRTMCERRVHALVVVDEQGEASGVVTKVDVLHHFNEDLSAITVDEVMTPRLITISPEARLSEAVSLMLLRRVHQLVITKDDPAERRLPIGMLSVSDVVSALCDLTGQQN